MAPLSISVRIGAIYTIRLKMASSDTFKQYFLNAGDQAQKALDKETNNLINLVGSKIGPIVKKKCIIIMGPIAESTMSKNHFLVMFLGPAVSH